MKLILTQEVDGLGAPGDVVEVKDGYGRNYLVPRGLGIRWTRGGEKTIESIKSARAARAARDEGHAAEIKTKVEAATVNVKVRAGEGGRLFGTYYLRANQLGGGAHVANCGYVTSTEATGRGIARMMCTHSLERARAREFRAMQYNLVVSTNERAVRLWQGFGFEIVGTLPLAFAHPKLGYVDAFVMFKTL